MIMSHISLTKIKIKHFMNNWLTDRYSHSSLCRFTCTRSLFITDLCPVHL